MRPARTAVAERAVMGEEGVLLNTATDQVAYCNESALLVFELCDGTRSLEEIVALLQAAFEEAGGIAEEVRSSVDMLVDAGLLEYVA